MSNLQVKLSRLASRKVPALSLILVAITGMAVGVFAATITVSTTNSFGGEQGILHNNTGVLTILDNGLSVVSNVPTGGSAPNASSNFLLTGNKNAFSNAQTFTVGHWEESITVTDTVGTDTTAHAVKITINSGSTVPSGSALIAQVTYTMTGITGSTNPTITLYIDLNTSGPITAPLNIYINSN
jgi:hypothetical protein